MRVLVQRCKYAKVTVDKKIVGQVDNGIMALVSFTEGDNESNINYMVDKVINLRIFDDENGVMNKSLVDTKGSILSISQFTLYADTLKGRRPSYVKALRGDEAIKLYDLFNNKVKENGIHIETGIFGADMQVELLNDGPVTIMLEK